MSYETDKALETLALAVETLGPLERWAHQCHAASVHLVRSGVLGECRVARGACAGVGAQHSWVVLGDDCYDRRATIVDPTLWSYDDSVDGVLVCPNRERHTPHGSGSIWQFGRPDPATDEPMELTPRQPWSPEARRFLEMLGPLDRQGWISLAHYPVENWPAGEIVDAICESGLTGMVPVDRVGMLTRRNPGKLYLPDV